MNNPTIRIHNTQTDEVIDREMTNAEYAEYQAVALEAKEAKEKAGTEKAAAQAKLAALGLTADDLKALGL